MGKKTINICLPFLLAPVPSQNPLAIGCKRSPPTVEIRRTVGEGLQTFATVSLYWRQGWHCISFQKIDDCHYNRNNSFFTTDHWFGNKYAEKQPVAMKDCHAKYLQKSMAGSLVVKCLMLVSSPELQGPSRKQGEVLWEKWFNKRNVENQNFYFLPTKRFLAHLSTTCLRWAFVVVQCLFLCRQHLHCGHSRGNIFSSTDLKFGQNVCLDKISDECEFGSSWVKN